MASSKSGSGKTALLQRPHAFTIAALLLVIGINFSWVNLFAALDHFGGDLLLAIHAKNRTPPDNIVLIDIDQASLDHPQMLELAGNWPWARLVHGELLSYLAKLGSKAVIFDVSFSEPDVFNLASDQAFASAIKNSTTPTYLPLIIADDGIGSALNSLPGIMAITPQPGADNKARLPLIAPKALPPEVWRTGHINFLMDNDQIGRRGALYHSYLGWQIPSLAARVAQDLGSALPAQADIILNWYGQPFSRLSYQQIYLSSQTAGANHPTNLANKIIIIGSTAPGLVDFRPTPLGTRTPGQDILATTIANLEQQDWLSKLHPAWSALTALLFLLLSVTTSKKGSNPLISVIAALILAASVVLIAYLLLNINLQWLPFSAIAIGLIAQVSLSMESFLQERKKRQQAVQLFNRFLDPQVVRQLTNQSTLADAEVGRSQEITVLFSDIRGFTSLSETRSPEEVVALLNQYFDQQVEAIFQHSGTLDKFIGDAIMAFWGAPIATANHAVKAVSAALDMSDNLEQFRLSLDYPFEIGIGVHTGKAVVGLIGSSRRLDYTAIGDAVNLASRIEGETKGIARILVSESTRLACGDHFNFIDHGEFTVKGRAQSVRLFEPRRI